MRKSATVDLRGVRSVHFHIGPNFLKKAENSAPLEMTGTLRTRFCGRVPATTPVMDRKIGALHRRLWSTIAVNKPTDKIHWRLTHATVRRAAPSVRRAWLSVLPELLFR